MPRLAGEHLGDALQVLGDAGVGVFDGGRVHVGRGLEDVGALQSVKARLAQVVHRRAEADGGGIHTGKDVESLGTLRLALNASEHAVGFEDGDGRDGDTGQSHGAGETAAEVDACEDVFGVGVDVADDAAQPALGADLFRFAGVPDVHAAEVGAVGRRIADAVDDGDLAGIIEIFDFRDGWIEAEMVVDGQHPVGGDADGGTAIVVTAVSIGNDGVEVVVAAGELDDDEDRILGSGGHGVATPWSGGGGSLAQCAHGPVCPLAKVTVQGRGAELVEPGLGMAGGNGDDYVI